MAKVGKKGIELLEGYSRAQALACARLVALGMAHIASAGRGRWGLTNPGPGSVARFSVGWVEAVVLTHDKVSVLLQGHARIPGTKMALEPYGTAPGCSRFTLPIEDAPDLLPSLVDRFIQALDVAARQPLSPTIFQAHAPALADYIWQAARKSGRPPQPVLQRKTASDLSANSVFTILKSSKSAGFVHSGGSGEFEEGRSWKSAKALLEEAERFGERLPLLLAAAEDVRGVTHVGRIESITLTATTSVVRFSGLREFARTHPLTGLTLSNSGKKMSRKHRRPYALVDTPQFVMTPTLAPKRRVKAATDPGRNGDFADVVESRLKDDQSINFTTREALIQARRGQGRFRKRVMEVEAACRLTGVDDERLLVASHIKPWAECSNEKRLDGYNGLMLAPHVDHLFDRGWISFADDGRLLVSPELEKKEVMKRWGLAHPSDPKPFKPKQAAFLADHRARFGFKAKKS